MQYEQTESKTEQKHTVSSIRGRGGAGLTAQARAVFGLQNAAGNRAVAGVLAPSASAAKAPVAIQRDALDDALKAEAELEGHTIDYQSLAKGLLATSQGVKAGGPTSKPAKLPTVEELNAREAKLKHKPTTEEQAILDKKADLDALEKEQQTEEQLRQWQRQQKPLNPERKSLSQLLQGRTF